MESRENKQYSNRNDFALIVQSNVSKFKCNEVFFMLNNKLFNL